MKIYGLKKEEVRERIQQGFINKTKSHKTKTVSEIFIENIFSLFNFIILGIIIFVLFFYFRSGDDRLLLDSIGILTIAVINTAIAINQELKSKHALDKVNLLLKKKVTVIRDGVESEIEHSEIVRDDVVKLRRGDQVVVDGRVIWTESMEVDESLLTGESHPILKGEGDEVLSGSFCVSGAGIFKAEKIGDESYANSVTQLAKKYKFILTPLQQKINVILKIMLSAAIVLVLIKLIIGKGSETEADFVRDIATILISLVPQGLILMASVTYALGIYRISKIGAIIQKLNAVESFSNVKVVCMDKTGTLTMNKLNAVKIIDLQGGGLELLRDFTELSTERNATIEAIEMYAGKGSGGAEKVSEQAFSSATKFSKIEVKSAGKKMVMVLGAYDILLEKMNSEDKMKCEKIYNDERIGVYRNLIFGIEESGEMKPMNLISISDTIREDVYEALKLFEKNEIEYKILSGDSAEAIEAILREIGLEMGAGDMVTGKQLQALENIDDVVRKKKVFARLVPEDKLRIIKSLKKQKIYTAMIGDGVNDLPAIKEADMGIAMEEGSQITKEVADIVLLKNKFSLLPKIFDEGNKIVNSVSHASKLFLTKNFMVIYLTVFSFMAFAYPLTPRRVSLLNIFAIGIPALILTMKNMNTDKNLNFVKDVISYVVMSSVIIVGGGYIGYYTVKNYFVSPAGIPEMVMMAVMIFIAIGNFLIVGRETVPKSGEGKQKNRKSFIIYAGMMMAGFAFFAATKIDFILFDYVKMFYEIITLDAKYWIITIGVSVSCIVVMAGGWKVIKFVKL